jgi:general secretion pathway protein G
MFSVRWTGKGGKAEARLALPAARCSLKTRVRGFTLLELVITLTVLSIMTLGVVPLVKMSVRRQREQRLRDTLREMRLAIEEFHRDTIGMQCAPGQKDSSQNQNVLAQQQQQQGGGVPVDPRSKVVISDCKLFTVDNPDHYPPDLDALVNGVNVLPRGGGNVPLTRETATSGPTATEANSAATSTKKKVYLRAVPVDPVTGESEWNLRSCYDEPDSASWGKENVFDVRSKAEGTALNGEKYSDW